MFRHKSKGKGKRGESSSSSQASSGTSADLYAVMILLNFYLHVLIHYYFIASHLIYFIIVFCWQGNSASRHRWKAFLGALHDEGQQEMATTWPRWLKVPEALEEPEVSTAQQEAPEEPEVRAMQQQAHEEPNVRAAQQEAPEEMKIRAAQQEAPEEPNIRAAQ
jgi:hypothetical protein